MDIPENFDWRLQLQKHVVLHEDLGGLVDDEFYNFLVEFDGLAPLLLLNFSELLDGHIQRVLLLSVCGWRNKIFVPLVLIFNLTKLLL